MIGRLRGFVLEKEPPLVLLESGGIGYEVRMPITCFYKLPDVGKEVIIFTHFMVREDTHLLFGFNHKQERTLFRDLIKTNGVGPKLALTILSSMSAKQFVNAIEQESSSVLADLPGIGKKTAERLIIEMKDRFKKIYSNVPTQSDDIVPISLNESSGELKDESLADNARQEAVTALMILGYNPQEANRMVRKVIKPDASSEILIREALRTVL